MKLFNNLFHLLIFQDGGDSRTERRAVLKTLTRSSSLFGQERPDARERLSERQQAFFVLTTDQRKVKGERALSLITV